MTTEAIQTIQANGTYKQVLKDSFGGVMYDVANQGTYEQQSVDWIIEKWEAMTSSEQSLAGGIMRGAMNFLTEDA